MLKTSFKTQLEFDLYKVEQKIRMEKGYLTVSERNQLKPMLEKNYKPTIIKEPERNPYIKSIITNYQELRKPCVKVEEKEDISSILKELKETCLAKGGLGLTANQIGYNKRISYLRIPNCNPKTKQIEIEEIYLINPIITNQSRPIKNVKEQCLSFPGIAIDTKRFVFIIVTAEDENRKIKTIMMQDIKALIAQHEIDHCNGVCIMNRKWRSK